MTLTIKRFKISSEMVRKLERGEELLSTDLDRAIKESGKNE